MTLYGISNCDTVRKARAWLAARGFDAGFHDFRRNGVDAAWLEHVSDQVGWETLLNRRGSTWRRLDASARDAAAERRGAIRLMLDQPALIKRPVLEKDGRYHLGFSAQHYQILFGE